MNKRDSLKKCFKLVKKPKLIGGALICRTSDNSVTADKVFHLLESIYGPPNLDTSGLVFIDRKSSWEWIFETPNGYLACYDYRDSWSIGYRNEINDNLKKDAEQLLELINELVRTTKGRKKRLSKFENFIYSFGATRLLLQRAHDEGFLIEGLILYTTLIDGMLRMALILKEQIDQKSHSVNESFIHQDEEGPKFSERKIIKMAYDGKIMQKRVFNRINNLYDKRNRIVHRFFLSKVEYADLSNVLIEYEKLFQKIGKIVYMLEEAQIKKGVGMTRNDSKQSADTGQLHRDVYKKIDSRTPLIIKPERFYLFNE